MTTNVMALLVIAFILGLFGAGCSGEVPTHKNPDTRPCGDGGAGEMGSVGSSGSGGVGGAGNGGMGGAAGSGGAQEHLDCVLDWNPADAVKALGRMRPDGSQTGFLLPGDVNVSNIALSGPVMTVQFDVPMPDTSYVVVASPLSSSNVVTFVPRYVAYDLAVDGFKLAVYNVKGEPQSWDVATTVEVAFVVY